MSGSGREERLSVVKKCYNSQEWVESSRKEKNYTKLKEKIEGRIKKKKYDYSRALVSGREELENVLLRLESALGKAVKHGCQLCKNRLLLLFSWTNIWHTMDLHSHWEFYRLLKRHEDFTYCFALNTTFCGHWDLDSNKSANSQKMNEKFFSCWGYKAFFFSVLIWIWQHKGSFLYSLP